MNKLLSIIVPCYNMEQYLARCLDSLDLHSQVHSDLLDVLVINDGSNDQTSAIAHQYGAKYPSTLRVIDKSNGHYGSCVNAGLAAATGTFIKILEPDDVYDTEGFDRFLTVLSHKSESGELDKIDLILSNYEKMNADGKIIYSSDLAYQPDKALSFEDFQAPLSFHILLPAVTYRLSILQNMDYRQTEGCPYTDLEWLTLPMRAVRNVVFFPCTVYKYLIGREGQSVQRETFLRNAAVIVKLIAGMLRRYRQLLDPARPAVQKYVDKVILAQLGVIYRTYLLEGRKIYNQEELREFDELLRHTSPELYRASDFTIKSRWFTYHYVGAFRHSGLLSSFKRKLFFAYAAIAARR